MRDQETTDVQASEADTTAESNQKKCEVGIKKHFTLKNIAIVLAITVVVQGTVIVRMGIESKSSSVNYSSPEVSLGEYRFVADADELGRVASADFDLSLALLENVERVAKTRLVERKYRVQQEIEQLLRDSHSGDFDDPKLGGLRRQIQERVSETIGLRAIGDVMITSLRINRDRTAEDGDDGLIRDAEQTKVSSDDQTVYLGH